MHAERPWHCPTSWPPSILTRSPELSSTSSVLGDASPRLLPKCRRPLCHSSTTAPSGSGLGGTGATAFAVSSEVRRYGAREGCVKRPPKATKPRVASATQVAAISGTGTARWADRARAGAHRREGSTGRLFSFYQVMSKDAASRGTEESADVLVVEHIFLDRFRIRVSLNRARECSHISAPRGRHRHEDDTPVVRFHPLRPPVEGPLDPRPRAAADGGPAGGGDGARGHQHNEG